MSRHLYDIGQMLNSPVAEHAIHDEALYRQIVEHRRKFIGLRGFDYDSLYPPTLNFIPHEAVAKQWASDYENMQLNMIYGKSVTFDELLRQLKELNKRINELNINA